MTRTATKKSAEATVPNKYGMDNVQEDSVHKSPDLYAKVINIPIQEVKEIPRTMVCNQLMERSRIC